MDNDKVRKYFEKMYLIRTFENTLETYFEKGLLRGTTHGYTGQEAIAVGVLENVNIDVDFVTSGHRCHGHYLAINDDILSLAAEIMGKENGIINGKGASQHVRYKNFLTNGITGGMLPTAVGMAFAKKQKKEKGVVVSFLGDGAMNEGYVMEAFNLASAYGTPNIFILENNSYAMSTDTQNLTGCSFKERVAGFGIYYNFAEVHDVFEVERIFNEARAFVEENQKPYFIEFKTFRHCGHSKSDKKEYFKNGELAYWLKHDPMKKLEAMIDSEELVELKNKVDTTVKEAFEKAMNSNEPDPLKVLNHIND